MTSIAQHVEHFIRYIIFLYRIIHLLITGVEIPHIKRSVVQIHLDVFPNAFIFLNMKVLGFFLFSLLESCSKIESLGEKKFFVSWNFLNEKTQFFFKAIPRRQKNFLKTPAKIVSVRLYH